MQMENQRDMVENNRVFWGKYYEYLSLSRRSRIQGKIEDLLCQVAQDAFMEGWLAAGGVPPYIIRSSNPAEQTPPEKE